MRNEEMAVIIAVVLIVVILLFSGGVVGASVGKDVVLKECTKMGTTIIGNRVLECKVRS